MSEELKIELKIETDKGVEAKKQIDNLINEYNNKKPINLGIKLGNAELTTFKNSIQAITNDLTALAGLKFSNLKTIETSLKSITKLMKEYGDIQSIASDKKNSSNRTSNSSILGALDGFDNESLERLSKSHKEALSQVKSLQESAEFLKQGFKAYQDSLSEAYKTFESDNSSLLSTIKEYEKMSDSSHFKKLITFKKELNQVINEYNQLGVSLNDVEHVAFEKYDGSMATRKYQEYADSMGLSASKFEELVIKAKELNTRKRQLLKNLENNMSKASDEEKAVFNVLNNLYDEIPPVDTSKADGIRDSLKKVLEDDIFKLDFGNLDLRFEDDFREAYNKFFKVFEEIKDEYNSKFKDVDGFESFKIFDEDKLKQKNENLSKEIDNTVETVKKLKDLDSGSLETLGFSSSDINVFETLGKSANELETKLDSLKTKFNNAFEISGESAKSLDRIKEALLEINKLTNDQKQTFFDFGLDTEKIKKAKTDTEALKTAIDTVDNASFSGLLESYSRLEDAAGSTIKEIEKLRTSAMSTATLTYGYEENDSGDMDKVLKSVMFNDEISKRSKELIKEYTSTSKELLKAQRDFFDATNSGKSSDETISLLDGEVGKLENKLSSIKNAAKELEDYPDVLDSLANSFKNIDNITDSQRQKDSLKILDKKDLEEANRLLSDSKKLIDAISKDSVSLQKDTNAGYKDTAEELEAKIKRQEQQLTSNISSLMNISNSKNAIDQVFKYQIKKAEEASVEIARINDKANKTTGTKIVDEQDVLLKKYKNYLTELKAIEKSLNKETNAETRSNKIVQFDNTLKELEKIESKLNEVKKAAASDLYNKTIRDLNLNLANSFTKTSAELDKVEEKIKKLGKSDYVNESMFSSASKSIENLRAILNKGIDNLDTKELSSVRVEIEKLKQSAKDIDIDIKLSKDSEKIETFIKGATERLEILQSTANGVDISHITRQFKELSAGSDKNSIVMKSITDNIKNLETSLKKSQSTIRGAGLSFRSFFEDLGSSLRTFTLGDIIGDAISNSLYQTWDIIKEIDSSMANMKKVADEVDINSSSKLENIRNQAIDIAKDVGMASSDVINAIADTLQAGVGNMETSIEVARKAMILANVGDMTQEAASESLNTIINGYRIEPLREIGVEVNGLTMKTTELSNAMDLLNYAGNNYAIGTDGVAEAMKRGGTVLSQYGVTLSDSVALITSANEAIQNPEKVGNGLKSIAINLAGIKANAFSGTLELNKSAKALKEIADIEVYSDKSKGEVKNMIEILDELYAKIQDGKLKDDEVLAIGEALAGKHQASVLQSLLGNYETFIQLRDEFAQGLHFDSAEKENAAYVDSLAGKLNKLKEIWTDILTTLAKSDSIKGMVDGFIVVSEAINKAVESLDNLGILLPTVFGLFGGGSTAVKMLWNDFKVFDEANKNVVRGFKENTSILKSGLIPSMKGFLKQGALIAGITAAVQMLAGAWDFANNSVKKAGEELQAVAEEQLSNISSEKEKLKTLKSIGIEYEKLANKANKTADEESKMLELGNELAKIMPEIQIGTDEDGNAIISMTDNMQGYIDKTKEAIQEQNRLLVGTRIEQSDNALKMLTKGELSGKDAKGLNDQRIKVQEDYNIKMESLQNSYNTSMQNARNFEGKNREIALQDARRYKKEMLIEESKYATEYSEIQSRIMEQSNIFRQEMSETWENSASYLAEELSPALQKSIKSFTNSLDFSEIDSEDELEAVRRIFREIPQLAQDGAIDIESLRGKITDINKEFSNTGDLEAYNLNMSKLADSISEQTGWDTGVLKELFTVITNGSLESSTSLNSFLKTFGKTTKQIQNGDSVAKALQGQFVEMERVLEKINNHDFGSVIANYELRTNLQLNEDLPVQVRDMITKMAELEVDDKAIITVAGEVLMSLKDGKIDEGEATLLKEQLYTELEGKLSGEDLELTVNAILKSFNSDSMLKAIEDSIGEKEVTKNVTFNTNGEERVKQIDETIKILAERPNVEKKVNAVVEGEEDLILFGEIIKRLPVNKDFTNKFIIENAEALSKLSTYSEVIDYINEQPKEFRVKYGMEEEGVKETVEKLKEADKLITDGKGKTFEVKTNNDDVLGTIKDIETLIGLSAKVKDGKYNLEINATTKGAIDNINILKDAVNSLSEQFKGEHRIKFTAETGAAARNISGLIKRVEEIKKLNGKEFKYNAETGIPARKISGLIERVKEVNALKGKVFYYNAETGVAARKISGLITRIQEINKLAGKSFSYSVHTTYSSSGGNPNGETFSNKAVEGNVNSVPSIGNSEISTLSESDSVQAINNVQPAMLSFNGVGFKSVELDRIKSTLDSIDLTAMSLSLSKFNTPSTTVSGSLTKIDTQNVNFNSPLIHIEGNVDKEVMADLEKFGNKLKKEIVNEIKNGDIRKKRLEGGR